MMTSCIVFIALHTRAEKEVMKTLWKNMTICIMEIKTLWMILRNFTRWRNERLCAQTTQAKKTATLDKPSADNYRKYNNYIFLCILVNSYIVGDLMENKFTLFNYMCDILENFYDKNGLEHLCALDSQYAGNYNDIYQLAWLIRFCEVWEKVEQREVNR